jgi:hypothetical protein
LRNVARLIPCEEFVPRWKLVLPWRFSLILNAMQVATPEELDEIDRYLAEAKTLRETLPKWPAPSGKQVTIFANWPIVDSLGVGRGELRFRVNLTKRAYPSVSLLLRGRNIYRIDIVAGFEVKPNPLGAAEMGLPPWVTGSHWHRWEHNRRYLERSSTWETPYREPIPSVRRLPQALAELASATNITLTKEQRGFDIPPQDHLFENDGP